MIFQRLSPDHLVIGGHRQTRDAEDGVDFFFFERLASLIRVSSHRRRDANRLQQKAEQ